MTTTYAGQWGPEAFLDRRGNALPEVEVTVYLLDKSTLATCYSDRDRTPLANPLPIGVAVGAPGVDSEANGLVWLDPGRYWIKARYHGAVAWQGPVDVQNDPAEPASGGGPPSGAAGGVLGGTYPNPAFAVDMATQAELDAEAALARDANNLTSGTIADARIPAGIARDTEVATAVAAEALLARDGSNITSGTVSEAHIDSAIARDTEVASAVSAEATARNSAISSAITTEATNRDSAISTAVAAEATARNTAITTAVGVETTRATAAEATLIPLAQKGAASGVAPLDAGSLIADVYIPSGIARDSEVATAVAAEATARTAAISAAIAALVNSAPGLLDTLKEIADALGDDPNFAATMTTALAGKQPLDAELTAWAGLASAADRLGYFTGAGSAAVTVFTTFARTLLDDTDAATMRATLGLGTAATTAASAYDAAGAAAAAQAASQPLDTDLTAIAALTTAVFGRSLLTATSAATAQTTLGLVIGTDVQAHSATLDATTAAFTTALATKLSGIATGATANSTDAFLLNRLNHTGSQAESTVTGLVADLLARANRYTILPVKTAAYSANPWEFVRLDTTAGTFASPLPTNPVDGSVIAYMWLAGTIPPTVTCGAGDVLQLVGGSTTALFTGLFQVRNFTYYATDHVWVIENHMSTTALDAIYAHLISPTFTGTPSAPVWGTTGITGAVAASRYVGATVSGAPVTGTFLTGDYIVTNDANIYICTAGGSPGTWAQANSNTYALKSIVDVFTTSGTYTKRTGMTHAHVIAIGAGGGGGSGRRGAAGTLRNGGGSGSSGGQTDVTIPASLLSASHPVSVGAGGTAGAAQTTNDTDGLPGGLAGNTQFGLIATDFAASVFGAGGGLGGTAATGAVAGLSLGMTNGLAGAVCAVGVAGSGGNGTIAAPVGGAGGGITVGNVAGNGGAGGRLGGVQFSANVAAGGVVDTTAPQAGQYAGSVGLSRPGSPGGGGAASITTAAQAGGASSGYGAGGAGGGASLNGNNSGAGAVGGPAVLVVFTYF